MTPRQTPATTSTTDGYPAPPPPDGAVSDDGALIESWQHQGDDPPTPARVRELLATLPPLYGTQPVHYVDFVQPLSASLTLKVPNPENPTGARIDQRVPVWALYVTVAGRLRQALDACRINGWRMDFEPEANAVHGPGLLILTDSRVVYREYCVITQLVEDPPPSAGGLPHGTVIGRRPGMASSRLKDGQSVEASNPWEVVETSARGRSLAAWGFGVLPGSGVASADEMRSAAKERAAAEADARHGGGRPRRSSQRPNNRQDLLNEVYALAARVADARSQTVEQVGATIGSFAEAMIGAPDVWNAETRKLNWDRLNDGQVQMVLQRLRQDLDDLETR